MDLKLRDRVAFVAGSSRGIGKAIAAGFLAEGARTIITGRDRHTLEQAAADFHDYADRLLPIAADLTDPQAINDALVQVRRKFGAIDCLVANVGSGRGKTGWALADDDWSSLFQTNLFGGIRLVEAALPEMTRARRGSIVLISSIAGVESSPAPLPYSAAKAALINYTANLSRLLGADNVRVNCVAPGNILFPGGSWERHLAGGRDKVMNYINAEVPMARFGSPEEIADLVVYLASDRASFITGACVVADGGQTRSI